MNNKSKLALVSALSILALAGVNIDDMKTNSGYKGNKKSKQQREQNKRENKKKKFKKRK